MADQKMPYENHYLIEIPDKRFPLDYCPNSPDTKHDFMQQEYEPEVKSCFWCKLMVAPEIRRELSR